MREIRRKSIWWRMGRWLSGPIRYWRLAALRERRQRAELIRKLDHLELKLEHLRDRSSGLNRIRCSNDLHWLHLQRHRYRLY